MDTHTTFDPPATGQELPRPKRYMLLRALSLLVWLAATVFLAVLYADVAGAEEELAQGIGLAVFIIMWALACIAYAVSAVFSAVGLFLSCRRSVCRVRGQILCFSVLTALPVLSATVFFGLIFLV